MRCTSSGLRVLSQNPSSGSIRWMFANTLGDAAGHDRRSLQWESLAIVLTVATVFRATSVRRPVATHHGGKLSQRRDVCACSSTDQPREPSTGHRIACLRVLLRKALNVIGIVDDGCRPGSARGSHSPDLGENAIRSLQLQCRTCSSEWQLRFIPSSSLGQLAAARKSSMHLECQVTGSATFPPPLAKQAWPASPANAVPRRARSRSSGLPSRISLIVKPLADALQDS